MPLSATDGGWLRQLIDATPIGLVVVSRDGHIMVTNTELEHQFGYSRAELLGKQVEMLLPERYQNSHHGLRGDYSRTPQKRPMGIGRELFGRRKDGMEFPIEIGLNPIETETGPAVIASICDISVRTRLHTNFRQMVEASPVGTLMIDGDGRIGFVNAKLCQLFGYEENQLIGEKLEVLLPPHFRNGHVELRNAFFENPDARAMGPGRDLSGLRKDGSEFAVEVGLSPVYTEDGIAVVAAVTDISARKAMELHLRKLNEDLDEFSYVALRAEMSVTAATTAIPSSVYTGLSPTSTANSEPSLRKPLRSLPGPMARASGFSKNALRNSTWPLRKCGGSSTSSFSPISWFSS